MHYEIEITFNDGTYRMEYADNLDEAVRKAEDAVTNEPYVAYASYEKVMSK